MSATQTIRLGIITPVCYQPFAKVSSRRLNADQKCCFIHMSRVNMIAQDIYVIYNVTNEIYTLNLSLNLRMVKYNTKDDIIQHVFEFFTDKDQPHVIMHTLY